MTATILRVDGAEAYDLIFTEHLSMLTAIEQDTMKRSLANSSRVWLGMDNGKILAMWGLIPPTLMSDVAYLWMRHTEHLREHKFVFIRHSQRMVQQMLEDYPTIVGHCACANTRAQQWLRWLGATFDEPLNDTYVSFTIKASPKWQLDSAQSA